MDEGAPNNSLVVYGTLGVNNPSNTPLQVRWRYNWTDQSKLWLYMLLVQG